jgi:UDP-N-acetylglucosamine 2-epimerase (non-hydrolysing)
MKKKKVLCVFGTRPEVIKMAPVIHQLRKYQDRLESRVCITGQHRQMLDHSLSLFQIQADIDLNLMRSNQSLVELTSNVLQTMTEVLRTERPDVVLVQGDTTTVMTTALAAFYERIVVGHIEAGLRTRNNYNPFPEEVNRRIAGVIATYHFAPTKTAVQALLEEQVPAERIFCTGNTVIDALLWMLRQPPGEGTLKLLRQLGLASDEPTGQNQKDKKEKKWILVTAHRRENFGLPFENISQALLELVTRNPEVEIVYPVHLNPMVQEPVRRILSHHKQIHLLEPLPYEPFVHLMQAVDLVLTDSGGVQEEAPALGKPVLVLRNETERPEAVSAGTVKLVGCDPELIISQTEQLLFDELAYQAMATVISPYGDGHAAERIVSVLLSDSFITKSGVEENNQLVGVGETI